MTLCNAEPLFRFCQHRQHPSESTLNRSVQLIIMLTGIGRADLSRPVPVNFIYNTEVCRGVYLVTVRHLTSILADLDNYNALIFYRCIDIVYIYFL